MVVALSNLCTNTFPRYLSPLRAITRFRVTTPAARGITTNRNTLRNSVLYGTVTFDTPRRNFTMGTNATRIIRSLVATCTTVYAGLPLVNLLQTKTMAVQGAAPSNTAPARYCVASSGAMNPLKITNKKKLAIPYIVNGLINQLVIHVINKPFGFFPASLILLKSTFIIIG